MVQTPTLRDLLRAGAHFGHKVSKRHPSMEKFIFGQRGGVHIFNLEKTAEELGKALEYLKTQAAEGRSILFVGTKKQVQVLIKQAAIACGMPYVIGRWLGGTITNFSVIRKQIEKLINLRTKRDKGELQKYTKKEQLEFEREIARLDEMVGGIETLTTPPDVMFIWDIRTEKTAFREANRKKVPVVAVCDTNVNSTGVTRIIPSNDDAVKTVELISGLVAEAVNEGKAQRKQENIKTQEQKNK